MSFLGRGNPIGGIKPLKLVLVPIGIIAMSTGFSNHKNVDMSTLHSVCLHRV